MRRLQFGVAAGLLFGVLDVVPMIGMAMPNKWVAIAGAFVNRFAIGFVIPQLTTPWPGWLRGMVIGFLLSLPNAIITGAWAPILGIGLLGGTLIGVAAVRLDRQAS